MKFFIFFSLVFILIPLNCGQDQKIKEWQALIYENSKRNPEITAKQSRVEMTQESLQEILKISVKLAEVRFDEAVNRQGIIRQGLSKPDSINNIAAFRQAQCDFNLLV